MRKSLAILVVVLCASLVGCKKKDKDDKKAPAKPTPTKTTPDPTKTDPKAPAAPTMVNKMANCPNAVEGADTQIAVTKAAVVVTVTAKDQAATDEIRKRAKHLASVQTAKSDKVEHTGKGTGSAKLGKCPIMLDDVKLEVKEIDKGVEVSMTPNDAGKLALLEHNAKSRTRGLGRKNTGHKHGSGMGGGGSKGKGGKGVGGGDSKGADGKKTK